MSFQDFQKAPNRLSPREIGFLVVAGLIALLVVYGLAMGNYYLANDLPDGGEFYLLRTAGSSFLFDRIDPYSGSVPARVQELVYGRPANSGEDLYIFDIPFHLMLAFFPLALSPDPLIARAFWMALTEIALAGFIYFSFRLLERRIPMFLLVLLSIAGYFSFYAYKSFLEGSLAILLGLTYLGILLALRIGQDELAGGLMVLSAIQWEVGGPYLLFVILWVFWEKRWRVFIGFGMLTFVLFIISFFLYPGWILPFLQATWNSIRVGFGLSMHEILINLWPQFGRTLGWILTALLLVTLGYEWRAARGNFTRFIWAVSLTLAATPLLGHRLEIDQIVSQTFPVILILVISRERWKKLGNGVALLLLLFYFGLPWIIFTQGLPQEIGLSTNEILFLFWPIFTVLGLYWIRWWTLRPPRTWLERATEPIR
jgi:hypothetical protein